MTALCREVARAGGLYATHTRNRDEAAVEAVAEAVRTAEAAGVRLQVSHITPRGGREDTERCIGLVEAARDRGADAAFDMHTRFFGTTYLKVMLPPSAKEGGPAALARRLADPAERARMKTFRSLITALGDWERIVLLDNPALPENSRRSIADIARETGCDPYDAAYDILLAEVEQLHRPMVILHSCSEELLRLTYRHDACTVGSDATTLAPDGKLAGSTFHGAYTWASWFYRRTARETRIFTPEEAIRKLAGLPAERLGLGDRGRPAHVPRHPRRPSRRRPRAGGPPRELHADIALFVVVFAIGISIWVQYARTVRGSTMVEKSKEYVQAAPVTGFPPALIVARHVLPNVLGPVLVIATIGLALAIIIEATLSFLGLGLSATEASLGTLIRIGNDFLFSGEWWITIFPSAALIVTVLAVNILGDWLRDVLNPKLR